MKRSELLNRLNAKALLNIPCADSDRALSEKVVQAVFGYRALEPGLGARCIGYTPKVKIYKITRPTIPHTNGVFPFLCRAFVGPLFYFFLLRILVLLGSLTDSLDRLVPCWKRSLGENSHCGRLLRDLETWRHASRP